METETDLINKDSSTIRSNTAKTDFRSKGMDFDSLLSRKGHCTALKNLLLLKLSQYVQTPNLVFSKGPFTHAILDAISDAISRAKRA